MAAGERPMLCVANLSRLAQQVELDLRQFGGATPVEVFGQNRFAPIGERPYSLTLAPYGFFWFSLQADTATPGGSTDGPAHLSGSWPDVLRRRARLGRAIARWIPDRRWFVGKGAVVRDVTVDDIVDLGDDVALAIVRTSFTEGDDHLYSVPLLHTTAGHAEELEDRRPGSVIATARRRRHRRCHDAARRGRPWSPARRSAGAAGAAAPRRPRATRDALA